MQQKKRLVFERNALYEEVWSEPMTRVAAKYGISNNGLKNICLKMNIPFPPNGYWRKLITGYKVFKEPLPETSEKTKYITSRLRTVPNEIKDSSIEMELDALNISMDNLIAFGRKKANKHTYGVITKHKKVYDVWMEDHRSIDLFRRNPTRRLKPGEPELWSFVSARTLPRAYRFLNMLFSMVDKIGGSIIDICTIELFDVKINFVFEEMKTRTTFVEAKSLGLITPAQYRGRKFDSDKIVYCPNGKLLFKIPDWFICKDSSKKLLEDRIDEIVMALIKEALRNKKK